jgi:hypothetical protein
MLVAGNLSRNICIENLLLLLDSVRICDVPERQACRMDEFRPRVIQQRSLCWLLNENNSRAHSIENRKRGTKHILSMLLFLWFTSEQAELKLRKRPILTSCASSHRPSSTFKSASQATCNRFRYEVVIISSTHDIINHHHYRFIHVSLPSARFGMHRPPFFLNE